MCNDGETCVMSPMMYAKKMTKALLHATDQKAKMEERKRCILRVAAEFWEEGLTFNSYIEYEKHIQKILNQK